VILNAANSNKVTITLKDEEDEDGKNRLFQTNAIWNVSNALSVEYNIYGQQINLENSEFHAEYAKYAIITSSTYNLLLDSFGAWYLPSNTTFNCYGRGCAGIDSGNHIYPTQIDTKFNTINVYTCNLCDRFYRCIGDLNNMFEYTSFNIPTQSNYDDSKCIAKSPPSIDADLSNKCQENEECVIKCSSTTPCSSSLINATKSTYLTMSCDGNPSCYNSTIICPDKGCDITCSSGSSCNGMYIEYNGNINDEGHINMHCKDYYESCVDINIYAYYVYEMSLICDGPPDFDIWTCYNLGVYVYYAQNINITGYNSSIWYSNVFAYNASNILLTADGRYSFDLSYLYSQYAKSVTIQCLRGSSCVASYFHVPSNAEIISNGKSGAIAIGSIDGVQDIKLSVDAMGICESIAECLDGLHICCDKGCISETIISSSWGKCDARCGCSSLLSNASVINLKPPTSNDKDKGLSVDVIILIIICVLLVMAGVYYLYVYFSKRYNKKKDTKRTYNEMEHTLNA